MPTKTAKATAAPPAAPAPQARRTARGTRSAAGSRVAPAAEEAVSEQGAAASAKPKRPKLVRDSFTIPKSEYAALQELKERALTVGHHAKKSELLRAGIKTLSAMTDKALLASLAAVPAMKTGRPAKD
jgi:hypothetical protein